MAQRLKNATLVHDEIYGVCLWVMPDGAFLGDEEGRFLSIYGLLNNPILELKMKRAAREYLGDEALKGKPLWMPGSRQVTDSEYEDQMDRMLHGKIPDVADAAMQADGLR